MRWLQRDDTTFYMDEMKQKERWQYYISSYMSIEPTEGVQRSHLQKTVLARNLPSGEDKSDESQIPKPLTYVEGLAHKICLNSLKIVYKEGTSECFVYDQSAKDPEARAKRSQLIKAYRNRRKQKMREKYVLNSKWMKDMSRPHVEKINDEWVQWIENGIPPPTRDGDAMDLS